MDEEKLRAWVNRMPWREAKTYAKTAPHEYLLLKDCETEEDRQMFWEFARAIREQGETQYFYQHPNFYYLLDDKKYWTMDEDVEKTELINRADKGNFYGPQEARQE